MTSKRTSKTSVKQLIINSVALITLTMGTATAADRVVVIPLGSGAVGDATSADVLKGKTFSSKAAGTSATGTLGYHEFCNGTPVGAEAFVLDIPDNGWGDEPDYAFLNTGQVYATKGGSVIEITGNGPYIYSTKYFEGSSFLVAPAALPDPHDGVKGTFYFMADGDFVFAKLL